MHEALKKQLLQEALSYNSGGLKLLLMRPLAMHLEALRYYY